MIATEMPRMKLSPTRILDSIAGRWPDRAAVVDGDDRYTYSQFVERVYRLVGALDTVGVRPGDRVAYLGVNSTTLLEMYHAVPRLGAILVPLNIRLSADDIDYILGDCEPVVAICDSELLPLLEASTSRRGIRVVIRDQSGDYESQLARARPVTETASVAELDTCEIFYTSGTTGRPKGVELTHRGVYLHALAVWTGFDYHRSDVQLHTIPLFHVNGWGTPHTLTLAGGTHVMLSRFDPAHVVELVRRESVTMMFLVPTMLVTLLEHLKQMPASLPSLRQVIVGGSALAAPLCERALSELGCVVRVGYGMTETGPVLSVAEASSDPLRASRTGQAIPGVELIVADTEGRVVARDDTAVGEILARGDHVLAGYWRQPGATAQLTQGGWVHTGDLATWDPTGSLRIVDRAKDIIISGGENISSVEVETALAAHPDVVEVAVVAAADERWGEIPVAYVVAREGAQLDEADLAAFVGERLARFKLPRRYMFVDLLPKGGTGKILKTVLRERAAQPVEKQ